MIGDEPGNTGTRAEGDDPEAGGRGAGARNPNGTRKLHQSAIRIWDGRRSAIRSIRFAATASRF